MDLRIEPVAAQHLAHHVGERIVVERQRSVDPPEQQRQRARPDQQRLQS